MEHREASGSTIKSIHPFLETRIGNIAVFFSYIAIATLAYWSILNNTLIGDDYFYTVKAGRLSFSGLWHLFDMHPSFIRPLPSLIFWLQYKSFGIDGTYSHLINVAFHAGNAYLLFWFLKKLRVSALAALVGSFMFLIMPIAVEPVTWSSGRFDLMATFFILLAVGLYLTAIQKKSYTFYAGAVFAAFAAMLCKESAMILVIIFPVMELLYGHLAEIARPKKGFLKNNLTDSIIRLLVFYGIFAGYIAMRFAVLGRLGGYKDVPFVAKPQMLSVVKTFWSFLSPVNSQFVPRSFLFGIGGFLLLLLIFSVVLVIFRWKSAAEATHKAWILLTISLFSALVPVNVQLFSYGIGHNLRDSRELYIISMLAIALIILGLFEFGWKTDKWKVYTTVAVLLLALPWFWGLTKNNVPWEKSALISNTILKDTHDQLPDPPPDAKIYFYGVPEWDGAYIFITSLKHAVEEKYDRTDLRITQIWLKEKNKDLNETRDGYLFVYDPEEEKLILVHEPERP